MEFTNAIKYGFKNYANFKGVVDRRTFWWWYLFAAGVSFVVQIVSTGISAVSLGMANGDSSGSLIGGGITSLLGLLPLAIYLPTLALMIRRLRDVGTNPLFLLFSLIPGALLFIGAAFGAIAGASISGSNSLAGGFAGLFLGMLPGILTGIGYSVWLIVLLAKPTKTAAQGNKFAIA